MTYSTGDVARNYIKRIRNPSKRAYAEQYWRWLTDQYVTIDGTWKPKPDRKDANISAMAAQAVEMRLFQIRHHGVDCYARHS